MFFRSLWRAPSSKIKPNLVADWNLWPVCIVWKWSLFTFLCGTVCRIFGGMVMSLPLFCCGVSMWAGLGSAQEGPPSALSTRGERWPQPVWWVHRRAVVTCRTEQTDYSTTKMDLYSIRMPMHTRGITLLLFFVHNFCLFSCPIYLKG